MVSTLDLGTGSLFVLPEIGNPWLQSGTDQERELILGHFELAAMFWGGGAGIGVEFAGALADDGRGGGHGRGDVSAEDGAALAVEHRAEEVEGAGEVEAGEVDMPAVA